MGKILFCKDHNYSLLPLLTEPLKVIGALKNFFFSFRSLRTCCDNKKVPPLLYYPTKLAKKVICSLMA